MISPISFRLFKPTPKRIPVPLALLPLAKRENFPEEEVHYQQQPSQNIIEDKSEAHLKKRKRSAEELKNEQEEKRKRKQARLNLIQLEEKKIQILRQLQLTQARQQPFNVLIWRNLRLPLSRDLEDVLSVTSFQELQRNSLAIKIHRHLSTALQPLFEQLHACNSVDHATAPEVRLSQWIFHKTMSEDFAGFLCETSSVPRTRKSMGTWEPFSFPLTPTFLALRSVTQCLTFFRRFGLFWELELPQVIVTAEAPRDRVEFFPPGFPSRTTSLTQWYQWRFSVLLWSFHSLVMRHAYYPALQSGHLEGLLTLFFGLPELKSLLSQITRFHGVSFDEVCRRASSPFRGMPPLNYQFPKTPKLPSRTTFIPPRVDSDDDDDHEDDFASHPSDLSERDLTGISVSRQTLEAAPPSSSFFPNPFVIDHSGTPPSHLSISSTTTSVSFSVFPSTLFPVAAPGPAPPPFSTFSRRQQPLFVHTEKTPPPSTAQVTESFMLQASVHDSLMKSNQLLQSSKSRHSSSRGKKKEEDTPKALCSAPRCSKVAIDFKPCPCQMAVYCSRQCQYNDWKSHKPKHDQWMALKIRHNKSTHLP